MKITGGCLNVRDTVLNEKVTAIKIYDGVKYTAVSSANCGQIVAVSGLSETYSVHFLFSNFKIKFIYLI